MGGKTFKNREGEPLADRIPTLLIPSVADMVIGIFENVFDEMEMVTPPDLMKKEDHGDIDFACLLNSESTNKVKSIAEEKGYLYTRNGDMLHLLVRYIPEGQPHPKRYQIDFICSSNRDEYEIMKLYYSNPTTFNAIVGHFARSIGYKFSSKGLLLHITDKRKQNFYLYLTSDLDVIFKILDLERPEEMRDLYKSPVTFAQWVMSSSRYDHELMSLAENMNAHRDAEKDSFCASAYNILRTSKKKATNPPARMDFNDPEWEENFDGPEDIKKTLIDKLPLEYSLLGDEIFDTISEEAYNRHNIKRPTMTGNEVIQLGYSQGPMIGKILQAVAEHFGEEDPLEDKQNFVLKTFPRG